MELQAIATDSAGQANMQFAKYQDTVENKINKLKTAWEQLRLSFINSDGIKTALDWLIKLLDKLNEFSAIDFATLGVTWFTFGKLMIKNFISGIQSSVTGVQEAFSKITNKIFEKFQNISQNSKLKNFILKITGDTSDIDKDIIAIQSNLNRLEQERITLISDDSDVLNDLKAIEAKIQEAKAEGRTITLGEAGQELQMSGPQIDAAGRLNNNLNQTAARQRQLQQLNTQKAALQQSGQAAGQAFASSFTTAVTAVMTQESPGKVFGTIFLTGLTSMIPTIISVATTMGIAVAGATAGISLLVTGLVAAGAALVKFAQNNKKAKLEQEKSNSALFVARKNIEELTEQQEKLNEEWSESSQKLEEQKNKYDSLTQAQEKLENYASKVALTTEEEEDFINTQNEIAQQFPELVSYYDEQGNAILRMGEAWDVIAEKQRQYYAEAYKEESIDAAAVALNELSILENQKAEAQALSDITEEYYDFAGALANIQTLDATGIDAALAYKDGNFYEKTSWENFTRELVGTSSEDSLLGALTYISDNIDESAVAGEQAEAIRQFLIKGGITGLEDKDNAKVIEEFKDAIKNNKKQAKDWQEALNRGREVIANSDDAFASGEFEASLINQTEKVNDALISIVESDLILEDSYNEATENVKGLMKEFLSTQAGVNLKDLQKEFAATEEIGKAYYDLEGNLLDEGKAEEANNALINWLENSKQYSDTLKYVLNTFNDGVQSQLDNFYLEVQQNDWGIVEQANEMAKLEGISPEVIEAWRSQQQEAIDAYNKLIEKSGEILGENVITDAETGLNVSSGQILNQILQLSTGAQEQLLNNIKTIAAEMGQESAKSYSQEMLNLKDSLNLTEEEFQTAMSADWANITAENFVEQKNKFMEGLDDSMTGEEAEQVWQEFFDISSKYNVIDISLSSDVSADSILDSLQGRLSETVSSYSGISDIIGSQLEDGFISFTESTELKDACTKMGLEVGDYISYGLNGEIYFDTDKLTEDVKEQLSNEDEALEAIRIQTQQKKDQIDAQIAILDGTIKTTNAQNNLTVETSRYAQYLDYAASILASMGKIEYKEKNITIAEENQTDVEEELSTLRERSNRYQEILDQDLKKGSEFWDTYQGMVASSLLEVDNKYSETKDSIVGDNEEIEDSLDKVNEAQEKVIEAQNELNEALYGEKYHKNALDFMYNYETALESVQRTADKAKEAIDDLSVDTDIDKNLQNYQNAIHKEAVLLKAESAEYQQAVDNYESVIKNRLKGKLEEINAMNSAYNVSTDIADYLYQGEGGMYYINYDALNLANIPDDFSDFLEESADQMNEWTKAILDNEDKLAEREKEIDEMHEQAIDNRVSLEERVQDILKQKYEEEVSDVEEKYSAMEEANDEYLSALEDALQKERDLRERSNQWEELAQKEKKLSLMQRDTSGANQADVLNLQNEIQDDREQLLDDTVDDILNTLKEQYELQKESHEQEIEFRNAMLEDSNLSAMAAEVINSWPSYETALDWFYQNDQEFAEASDAKREQLTNEWIELYNNSKAYDQINYDEMKAALYTTDQEVQAKMYEVTETATGEGERLLNQTTDDVKQSINDAQQALTDALESLAEAQQEYAEAVSKGLNLYTKLDSSNPDSSSSDTKTNSNNTKAYNTRLEAETAARTLAQAGNTGITIDEKDGKYYVNYTKKSNKASSNNQNNFIGPIKPDMAKEKQAASQQIKQTLLSMTAPDNKVAYRYILSDSDCNALNVDYGTAIYGNYELLTTTIKTARDVGLFNEEYKGILQSKEDLFGNLDTITGWGSQDLKIRSTTRKYASGGLVDYTGPAWVDGTKSKPEAFLSSDDTRRIGEAAELLSKLPILNSTSTSETQMASSIGDTSIEIHINIDKIESDYDVDSMIERVRQDIVDVANPTGTVQILRK